MNQHDDLTAAIAATKTAAEHLPQADQAARAKMEFLNAAKAVSKSEVVRHRDQVSALPDLTVREGKQPMKQIYFRRVAAVLLGVVIASGLWTSPAMRALAQEVINFFVQGTTDRQETVLNEDTAPRQAEAMPPSLTLEEAAAQVDFTLLTPTVLPPGYAFTGATYNADTQSIYIDYQCGEYWPLTLIEQHTDEPITPMNVGASAVIVEIPIRDTVGQYVRGAWYALLDEVPETQTNPDDPIIIPQVWTNDADWQQLVWRENGINFTLSSGGGIMDDHPADPCMLTSDDFAAMAQGLQTANGS